MSQQALIVDVAAKVPADNLTSLLWAVAADNAGLEAKSRKCNRSYAAQLTSALVAARAASGAYNSEGG